LSGGRRHIRPPSLIDFFACFLIPAYTLLFAGSRRWFSTNFSVIAVTGEDHYRGFFLWGVLAGGYFLVALSRVTRTFSGRLFRVALGGICLAACLSLGAALVVPYLPVLAPGYADLHVVLAFTACALLMLDLLLLLLRLHREDAAAGRPLLILWLVILLGCIALFVLCDIISSALEIWFTISTVLLTRRLLLLRCRP